MDADRTVHGVTSWLPVYRDGAVVGWTLDFMRRRDTGFRGVMEFLIASAVQRFQAEGAQFLSLSGAPLARLDRGGQPDAVQRLLDASGRALGPVYGFGSLLAFKAKFQPEYRPLHLCYPDPAALPAIGLAIARAYLPGLTARQSARLLSHLRRDIAPGRVDRPVPRVADRETAIEGGARDGSDGGGPPVGKAARVGRRAGLRLPR